MLIILNYIESGFLKKSRIEYNYKNWTIYLDTYIVSRGKNSTTYTRMRVPFIHTTKFYFHVYRKGIFSNIGIAAGMQDIKIGREQFDDEFIVKSDNEILMRKIFLNEEIRTLTESQPKIKLELKADEGPFGPKFNDDEGELSFMALGVIKNVDLLKDLFILFNKLLDELEYNGVIINQKPYVKLYKD
jgi:hypothetical protein